MRDRTGFKLCRRGFLTLGGAIVTSGCLAFSSPRRQTWAKQDAFPDDDNRNRECSVSSVEPGSGTINGSPFAYVLEGRGGIHGTDQHYNVNLSPDAPIDVYVSPQNEALTRFETMYREGGSPTTVGEGGEFQFVPKYSSRDTESYEKLIKIPDEKDYSLIVVPAEWQSGGRTVSWPKITVEYSFDCSYYLPFEEYKSLVE